MFDGPVETCLEYVKTADPEFYTDVSAIEGFCTTMGDVAANGGSGKTTATGGPLGPGIGVRDFFLILNLHISRKRGV